MNTRPDASMHFYFDDIESMRRYRKINKTDDVYGALREFEEWLRGKIKYGEMDEYQPVRDVFWNICTDYGIDPWEE